MESYLDSIDSIEKNKINRDVEKNVGENSFLEDEDYKIKNKDFYSDYNKINVDIHAHEEKKENDLLIMPQISEVIDLSNSVEKHLLKIDEKKKNSKDNVNKLSENNKTNVVESISKDHILNIKEAEQYDENEEERESRVKSLSRVERIKEEWNLIITASSEQNTFFDTEENYQRLVSLRSECKTVLHWTHLFCFKNARKIEEKREVRNILRGIDTLMPQATKVRQMSAHNERKSGIGQFFKNLASKSWSGIKAVGREIFGPITSISVREFTEETGIKNKIKGLFAVPARFLGTLIFSYAFTTVITSLFFGLNVLYQSVRPFLRVPVWLVDGIAGQIKKGNASRKMERASREQQLAEEYKFYDKAQKKEVGLSADLSDIMFAKTEQAKNNSLMTKLESVEGIDVGALKEADNNIKSLKKEYDEVYSASGKYDKMIEHSGGLIDNLNNSIQIKKKAIDILRKKGEVDEEDTAAIERMNTIISVQEKYLKNITDYRNIRIKLGSDYTYSETEQRFEDTQLYSFKNAWNNGAAKKMKVRLPYQSFRFWQAKWDTYLFKGNLAGYDYAQLHKPQNKIKNDEEEPHDNIYYIYNRKVNQADEDVYKDKYPEWINLYGWGKLVWKNISTFSKNVVSDYDDRKKIQERMRQDMEGVEKDIEDFNDKSAFEYDSAVRQADWVAKGSNPAEMPEGVFA